MSKSALTLIVSSADALQAAPSADRAGGETHGLGNIFKRAGEKKIPLAAFGANLDNALSELAKVVGQVTDRSFLGWEMDGITLSLAVSAEGSIGIATAGVEASIELSFSKPS